MDTHVAYHQRHEWQALSLDVIKNSTSHEITYNILQQKLHVVKLMYKSLQLNLTK